MRHPLLLLTGFPVAVAAAQNASVHYDHAPGDLAARVRYSGPGQPESALIPGKPPVIRLREGSQVCWRVDNPNPLLYTYSIKSAVLTPVEPDGGAAVITGLAGLTALGTATRTLQFRAETEPADVKPTAKDALRQQEALDIIAKLAATVGELSAIGARMDAIKDRTDRVTDWAAAAMEEARKNQAQAEDAVEKVNGLVERGRKNDDAKATVDLLKPLADAAAKRVSQSLSEIEAAKDARPAFCTTIGGARVAVTLFAVRNQKPAEGKNAARPVDSVETYVAEPTMAKRFEAVPVGLVAFGYREATDFEVVGTSLVGRSEGPRFVPGVSLMSRVGNDDSPLWLVAGTAPGRKTAPDFHFGLALRTGLESLGTNMILGAGLSLAEVATELNGASVGQSLPTGKSLDDVVVRHYRPGVAMYLSISRLSIGGDAKPKAAEGTPK